MTKNIILLIIVIIPIFILLKFIFDKDKIEKESFNLLFKLFISGIISALIALILSKSLHILISSNSKFYNSFIKIALIEELCKWIFIYIITWKNKEFDYKFDAIVYCIFLSLGFAFIENIGYSFKYGISVSLFRSIISVPGHAFFAIYMGYYLGLAKISYARHQNNDGNIWAIYSILIPTTLHGIYNFCLLAGNDILYLIFIIFIIALYILSFKTINISSNMDVKIKI